MTAGSMHAAILGAPPQGGLPSTSPLMYQQILEQAKAEWAAEDEQIRVARQDALHQAVLEACATAGAPGAPAGAMQAAMPAESADEGY